MKRSLSVFHSTIIGFVLGVLIIVQLRSTGRVMTTTLSSSDQATVLITLVESNAGLRNEIAGLEAQLARLDPLNRAETNAALQAELRRLHVISGDAAVAGPGVRVQVSGQINPLDMQDLINELRNAGAEAIAVNGHRIVVSSVVARQDSDLILGGERLTAPYVLEAIGQPDTMEKALLRRGGLVSLLQYAYAGLDITVEKSEGMTLPERRVRQGFTFAQPEPES